MVRTGVNGTRGPRGKSRAGKKTEKMEIGFSGARGVSGRGSRGAGFSPSAVWPACARVTVAMDRLAAAGRVAPRSAEAPRTVLLEPAATNFGAPTTLAPPSAVAAIVAPDAERGDAGLELRARLEGSSRSV